MSRTLLYAVLGAALVVVLGIPAVVMLLDTEQKIDCLSGPGAAGGAVPAAYTGPGLAGLDERQTGHAASVVATGQQMGLPREALVIALAVVSQESGFKMYANDGQGGDLTGDQADVARSLDLPHDAVGTDHGSVGLFQQQYPWWGSLEELMDAGTSARKFYEALQAVPGWQSMPLTVAAQRVQRSAFPDAYADDEALARRLVDELLTTGADAGAGAGTRGAGGAGGIGAGPGQRGPGVGPYGSQQEQVSSEAGGDPYGLGDVKPQLRALVDVLAPMFGITDVGGYRASATDPGGHPSGLAADFMVPLTDAGRDQGQRLTDYAQANADQLGIDYIIWYGEIWSVARADEGWRPMEDRGSPTANHMDHPHINVLPDAEASTISAAAGAGSTAAAADPECAAVLAAAGLGDASAGTTVATLNLLGAGHTGPGGRPGFAGWSNRLDRAMQALTAEGVSIAALQEAHGPQAAALSSPAYTRQWGVHPLGGGAQNRVVWNKALWEPVNRRMVKIPYFHGAETPMPLVKLRSKTTGEAAWVWSVHNPADVAPRQFRHRREALRRQLEQVQRLAGRGERVILAGDFNDAGDGRGSSHCRFTPNLANAFGTNPGAGGKNCGKPAAAAPVDHIYGANVDWSQARVVESVKASKISDHPMVIGTTMSMGATGGTTGGQVVHPMAQASRYSTANSYGQTGAHWARAHTGEDFSASCGEPVVAAHDGTVRIHTDQSWAGPQLVVIETGSDSVATWYAHMQAVDVADGTPVQAGQQIGQVGTEGNSTGCHLHFEVHSENGGYDVDDVDPLAWLRQNGVTGS